MQITCNGQPRQITDGETVNDLIVALGLQPDYVVAEKNGAILARESYDEQLADGDVVELIRFVGGG